MLNFSVLVAGLLTFPTFPSFLKECKVLENQVITRTSSLYGLEGVSITQTGMILRNSNQKLSKNLYLDLSNSKRIQSETLSIEEDQQQIKFELEHVGSGNLYHLYEWTKLDHQTDSFGLTNQVQLDCQQ